jgi:hypothetical protein
MKTKSDRPNATVYIVDAEFGRSRHSKRILMRPEGPKVGTGFLHMIDESGIISWGSVELLIRVGPEI